MRLTDVCYLGDKVIVQIASQLAHLIKQVRGLQAAFGGIRCPEYRARASLSSKFCSIHYVRHLPNHRPLLFASPSSERAMTIADVFIIESLTWKDENQHRHEGQRLAELLRLSGKNPKYFYFQSKDELPHLLKLFKLSNYRYLHVSCHASSDEIATTKENLTYVEFAKIFKGSLKLRRVFFSACELGNELFSVCLASTNKGMHSVVAPAEEIDFDHAAAIWAAFYVSVFARNADAMSGKDIRLRIELLCKLFPVDFHVSTYQPKPDTWLHTRISKSSMANSIHDTKTANEPIEA